jgi:hypothetical protein
MRTAALFLALATAVGAHEHAPRVLSPHVADGYSMKTFAAYPRWRDLKADAKVYEVFAYLSDRRTGIFPMGTPAWEGTETVSDFGAVRDPVKMFNVYPIGHCGTLGPTAAGFLRDMGVGPTRSLYMPKFNHVASEVFYDGSWHYVDLDLRGVFRREDGTLASFEDARRDPSLWKGPNGPLFFPLDGLDGLKSAYEKEDVRYRHGVNSGGSTMDYVLRRGETFTRWWTPQGGRWNHHPSYAAKPFPRVILDQEPRGPKCKHAGWSVHTHGNGRFVYRPDLTARSADFEDGVREAKGVRPGEAGLVLDGAAEGFAVFEVRSPYVIVPLVGDVETTDDDRDASVLKVDGEGLALSLSLDSGLTWKDLGDVRDLTPYVSGRHGYLLKVGLKGTSALLRSFETTTWVQLHPSSLPALRKGRNEMRYVAGDHHGLASHVVELRTSGSDFLKGLHEAPQDFDAARISSRARGAFVAKVEAPPGMKVAWFSGGGSFAAHQGEASPRTANTMAYSTGDPAAFKEFYRADVPSGNAHWHYNADVEVKLDAPAKTVFLRYVGDPGVNNLRIFAHCVADRPCAPSAVRITHAWRENGALKTKTVTLPGAGAYEVVADDEPEDASIEIAIPGGPR